MCRSRPGVHAGCRKLVWPTVSGLRGSSLRSIQPGLRLNFRGMAAFRKGVLKTAGGWGLEEAGGEGVWAAAARIQGGPNREFQPDRGPGAAR